tara:strand:- start:3616 stop:6465 length:2850 start_codon:yes stop_codon:yes gene_type:complete
MIQFKGFKPEAMQRIAGSLGYQGNMNGFNDYLNKNPDKMNAMNMYQDKAIQMANGGVVQNFDGGGVAGHPHPHAGTAILGEKGTVYNSRYDAAVNSNVGDTVIVDGITFVKSTGDGGSRTTGTYLQQVDTPAELSQALSNAGTGTTSTATATNNTGTTGLQTGAAANFLPQDILEASVGLGDQYLEYDIDGDGKVTSQDALAYAKSGLSDGTLKENPVNVDGSGTGFSQTTNAEQQAIKRKQDQEAYALLTMQNKQQAAGSAVGQVVTNPTTQRQFQWNGTAWDFVSGTGEGGYKAEELTGVTRDGVTEIKTVDLSGTTGTDTTGVTGTTDTTGVTGTTGTTGVTGTTGTVTGVGNTGVGTFEGGSLPTGTTTLIDGIPQAAAYQGESISELQANRAINPGLPTGSTVAPVGTTVVADQLIGDTSGQVTGDIYTPITTAGTTPATGATATGANTMTATQISNQVTESLKDVGPAVGAVDPRTQVDAQATTDTSVSGLASAQGTATTMDNPVQRKVEDGELISGVANAETAAAFTEEIEAATATPTEKATVQGQLEGLMQQFEGGNTPAWAAGSMRAATATMVSRGLGASSMAGQAIIQAAMEAALPIASADAQVYAQFESLNLSNRQQRAMLAAQQRAAFIGQEFDQAFQSRVMNASKVSDIANMNFTAEQQVALENSRNANTMNLSNLSNRQAIVMAEAAALSNLDMANLSNRQQAAVMNAQTFLQMDMANLNNSQQTTLFKSQQQIQSLFTDQAADNASKQFNATSENQTDQFFANLTTQVSQFNAAQSNAQGQFNAGQTNAQDRFASEMMNQRDQFNAQNRLVIDQQNANWRRQVATADTAAINRANEINAASILNMSNTAYNDLWSYYQDSMEYAWNSAENERGRISDMMITKLQIDAAADLSQLKLDYQASAGWGDLMANMFTSPIGGNTILGKGIDAVVDFLF